MRTTLSPTCWILLATFACTATTCSAFVLPFIPRTTRLQSFDPGNPVLLPERDWMLKEQRYGAESLLSEREEDLLFGAPAPTTSPSSVTVLSGHRTASLPEQLANVRRTASSCPDLIRQIAAALVEADGGSDSFTAILDEHNCDGETISFTFPEFVQNIQQMAHSMTKVCGIAQGDHVAVFAENSARWLLVDQGTQWIGAVTAVRGAEAPLDELRYIYQHSDSAGVVVLQGPKLLEKLSRDAQSKRLQQGPLGFYNERHGPVRTVVLLNSEKRSAEDIAALGRQIGGIRVYTVSELLRTAGATARSSAMLLNTMPVPRRDDLATIVYTSGTTGNPKGVMLTHGNLLHQTGIHLASTTKTNPDITDPSTAGAEPQPGELMLALLPVWHITERTFELWMLSRACTIVYSSIRTFKSDLANHQPQWLVLVPRVLEKIATGVQDKFNAGSNVQRTLVKTFTRIGQTYMRERKIAQGLVVGDQIPTTIQRARAQALVAALAPLHALGTKLIWSKVQAGFGGRIQVIISGGSALAGSLETFYETAGIPICVGYGLTECSPLLSYRRRDANLVTAGCTGKPCYDSEVRVVDPESKAIDGPRPALPPGQVGVVIGKGPQVMKGYYKNEQATRQAIDPFGWFDTGDLGRINPATGDLVLTGRAKDTIVLSNGENVEPTPIEDAILGGCPLIDQIMLTGQDGRKLVAVVVLNPAALGSQGYLSESEAQVVQKAQDAVNDPKCTVEICQLESQKLNETANQLRQGTALKKQLLDDAHRATQSGFRPWEKVGDLYLTLEPFAMVNGQLTQSYKVKRPAVQARYDDALSKL